MKKVILTLALVSLWGLWGLSAQTIRYVTPNGTGNGSSWHQSSNSIQAMIDTVYNKGGGEVRVAQGVYIPTDIPYVPSPSNPATPRDKSFLLKPKVSLIGGYSAVDTLAARDWQVYPTVLGKGPYEYNSPYHILTAVACTDTIRVEGFTVQYGLAYDAAVTNLGSIDIGGYEVERNRGGMAVYNSNIKLKDMRIKNNSSVEGGEIYCNASSLILENVRVDTNSAYGITNNSVGGGISCRESFIYLSNVTIGVNSDHSGGGLYLLNSTVKGEKASILKNISARGGGVYMGSRYGMEHFLQNSRI